MNATQVDKAQAFRALHAGPQPFVIANAGAPSQARILGGLGFPALATSSGACAATHGRHVRVRRSRDKFERAGQIP